jgi:hypothetical protein
MINHYSGDSAEVIAERPSVNGQFTNLSNFGTLTFTQSLANGNGINTYNPSGIRHGVHMINSASTALADPSAIGSGGSFTDTQRSCN